MNSKLFLFSCLFIIVCIQCKKECSDVYEIVCGEDGENYFNGCQARAVGIKFTEGPCIYKAKARVVRLEGNHETCAWVLEMDESFAFFVGEKAYFKTDKLSEDFQKDELSVEVTYTAYSDGLSRCYSNNLEYYISYMYVVDIVII